MEDWRDHVGLFGVHHGACGRGPGIGSVHFEHCVCQQRWVACSELNYITATFTTVSTGTVRLELQSNLSTLGLATGNTLTTGYLIRNVYLQLGATSTSTTGLGIGSGVNFLTGTGNSTGLVYPNGGSSLGTSTSSTQQADTEDFFNLRLGFDGIASATNALTANRFDDNDKAVFNLVRTGLTESSFTFLGAGGGGPLGCSWQPKSSMPRRSRKGRQ